MPVALRVRKTADWLSVNSFAGDKRRALVGGAGIGGLAAAAALANHFDEVVVIEKDDLSDGAAIRKGVGQGAHIHVLMKGGEMSLEKNLPAIRTDFLKDGAIELIAGKDQVVFDYESHRPLRDLGFTQLCMSRPGYERVIRRRVSALPNVTIRQGVRINRLVLDDGAAVGFEIRADEENQFIGGAFVVDARGRGSPLPRELEAYGCGAVMDETIGINMAYASARIRPGSANDRLRASFMCVPEPPDVRYGLAFPVEDGEWIVSLGGRGDIVPSTEQEEFLEFARALAAPDIYELLHGADFSGAIHRYKKPTANWRHYESLGTFPKRLAVVGDTIASYNPIYGQGMSVAIKHAEILGDTLQRYALDDKRLYRELMAKAALVTVQAWKFAASNDFAYPEVTGARDPDFERQQAFRRALRKACDEDPEIHRLVIEVSNMMRSPAALMDPAVVARVEAKMAETVD